MPIRATQLRERMLAELKKQGDPRVLGNGDLFDLYPTVKPTPKGWK